MKKKKCTWACGSRSWHRDRRCWRYRWRHSWRRRGHCWRRWARDRRWWCNACTSHDGSQPRVLLYKHLPDESSQSNSLTAYPLSSPTIAFLIQCGQSWVITVAVFFNAMDSHLLLCPRLVPVNQVPRCSHGGGVRGGGLADGGG